jgi:hypothetical protein
MTLIEYIDYQKAILDEELTKVTEQDVIIMINAQLYLLEKIKEAVESDVIETID